MKSFYTRTTLTTLSALWLLSSANAAPPPAPAPIQEAKPIPGDPAIPSEQLDIDFRASIDNRGNPVWVLDSAPAYYVTQGNITVTASPGSLTKNRDCDPAENPSDPNGPDGFGVDDGSDCDDGLGRGESLTVSIEGSGVGLAAFDVDGLWLTDFVKDGGGEGGLISITEADGTIREYSFSWKDDPVVADEPNGNGEYFVGFGETVRFTEAVLTATNGSFSVAGFSQQPIEIDNDGCNGDAVCKEQLAQNVFLDLKTAATPSPGDRGVNGVIFKDGVYIVEDNRAQCAPVFDPDQEGAPQFADWTDLPIDLDGDGTEELTMEPWQCGYPEVGVWDKPVIYILDIDGRDLEIVEDTITLEFLDDADLENGGPNFCAAPELWHRPGFGWVPRGDEVPLKDAEGQIVRRVQDVTTGPCGSGRGGYSLFSYVPYHWINARGTPYTATIAERIERLQTYVDQLFPVVQQGINQSTLSDDTGHISTTFYQGRYERTLAYIEEMRLNVLDPRLNDEIAICYAERSDESGTLGDLASDPASLVDPVPANVVGNLLVQLKHLDWMIRTTLLGQTPWFEE